VDLSQLLYISDAVGQITRDDLKCICETSMRNNNLCGITGILFFSGGHFVQFLEGPPDRVKRLFSIIVQDDRHEAIKLLLERPAACREFDGWDMALLDLEGYADSERMDLNDLVHMAGYQVRDESDEPMDLIILRRFRDLLTPA